MSHRLERRGLRSRSAPALVSLGLSVGLVACGRGEAPEMSSEAAFRVSTPMEEVMRYLIDPAADGIWDAVVTVVTVDGIETTQPETDEDWAELRRHAVALIETPNLLVMDGRPVAAEGSRSELPGVDLEPEEIEALLAREPDTWRAMVGVLQDAGAQVLDAVDRQDLDALLVAGDVLDVACENCHIRYWYPTLAGPAP